ncbi:hypothetical protein RB195_006688 [Necator americanus]|uniref:Uncharacterized protein n=1 Tax=Necator americanus TaxID=51031 RepID=A0ABR1BTS1_NECAM
MVGAVLLHGREQQLITLWNELNALYRKHSNDNRTQRTTHRLMFTSFVVYAKTVEHSKDVLANCSRLVKEVLSLRQKIVSERQTIHFLRRCQQHQVTPDLIANKRLHEISGVSKESRQMHNIEEQLRMALKRRRDPMFSLFRKCMY